MTLADLLLKLKTAGYPVAYHHFSKAPLPPYIVFLRSFDSNISSDEKVHGKLRNYYIELYTKKKDLEAEKNIEDVLSLIDTDYQTSEAYIDSEKMYQVVYQIKIFERS